MQLYQNLGLNIGPDPINTPLYQNWRHRQTALIQTTVDSAAEKSFSVLPVEINFSRVNNILNHCI